MFDLHCHTTFSDGLLSPEEIITKAKVNNIKVLSVTDHDTVAAYDRLRKAAVNSNVHLINGIELSTRWKKYDIHILGYNIQHTPNLAATIQSQSDSRIKRAMQIGSILETLGVEYAYNKACELAGHERVGRPHFAAVLVREGLARDLQTAFKRFLGRGRPAYIPTPWISIKEAVFCINEAGGQAVIAHPLKYGLTRTKLHELIKEFKDSGGVGIEVVSGEIKVHEIQQMVGICLRFDLLASSGSDFHGDAISRINLGRQHQLPINCIPIWHDWNF